MSDYLQFKGMEMQTGIDNRALSQNSAMEILSVEKNLEIGYHSLEGYLHCRWMGYQSKEAIIRSGEKILEFIRQKNVSKVLNDNLQVKGPWDDAAEWTVKEWFPRMEQAGLRHFAWIFSPNLFAELSAKKAMPASDVVKTFAGVQPAVYWLRNAK